ncbi:MAG TPA: hypothetical protein VFW40_11250 [Capsulimonadaceae bacterium]|nr:hypothetical protein [Capsulimonadaceae bacterium]
MAILRYRGVEDSDRFDQIEMFTGDPDNMFGVRMVRIRYDKRMRVLNKKRELEPVTEHKTIFMSLKKLAWAGVCALAVAEAFWFWEAKNLIAGVSATILVTLVLSAAWFAHEDNKSVESHSEISPRKHY